MKMTAALTAAALLGMTGIASAACGAHDVSASAETMTPIPTADAQKATETPATILPLPTETGSTEEG